MPTNNADRLAALRPATTVKKPMPWGRPGATNPAAFTTSFIDSTAALAAARAAAAALAAASLAAIRASQAADIAARGPIIATYTCCCCSSRFSRDITNDPDGRPSPLGDRCPACDAAGKQRPFDAAGMTLDQLLGTPTCHFCQGAHWAMDCSSAAAVAAIAADPDLAAQQSLFKRGQVGMTNAALDAEKQQMAAAATAAATAATAATAAAAATATADAAAPA